MATLIIAVAHFNAFSQVQFLKSSIQEAFLKAKKENKAVFVEIYADGCHHCEAFKKTFDSNKKVGDYFNQNFVSYQVEVNSEEGRKFRKDRNIYVMSTPLMTFWSADSTLLNIVPAGDEQNNENGILEFAKKALEPQSQWQTQKKAFYSGENNPNFLINLAYLARYTSDTLLNLEAMNRYAAYLSLDNFKNDAFVVIQKVLMDDENALFMHCINNLEEYYQKYGEKTVNDAIENIVMFSLYSSRAQNYNLSKLEFMKLVLKKIGVDERSINARFLLSETNLLLKTGQRGQVIQKFQNYINSNQKISKEEIEFIKKYLTNNKISAEWLTEKK